MGQGCPLRWSRWEPAGGAELSRAAGAKAHLFQSVTARLKRLRKNADDIPQISRSGIIPAEGHGFTRAANSQGLEAFRR
jgi:hypothetical protein